MSLQKKYPYYIYTYSHDVDVADDGGDVIYVDDCNEKNVLLILLVII